MSYSTVMDGFEGLPGPKGPGFWDRLSGLVLLGPLHSLLDRLPGPYRFLAVVGLTFGRPLSLAVLLFAWFGVTRLAWIFDYKHSLYEKDRREVRRLLGRPEAGRWNHLW